MVTTVLACFFDASDKACRCSEAGGLTSSVLGACRSGGCSGGEELIVDRLDLWYQRIGGKTIEDILLACVAQLPTKFLVTKAPEDGISQCVSVAYRE